MWIRRELKERAKTVLRNIYWKAFLVSLVIAFAQGNNGGRNINFRNSEGPFTLNLTNVNVFSNLALLVGVIGTFAFLAALRIFLGYPLEVGGRRYFIKSAQYNDNRNCFRFAFGGQNYAGIILTMLLKGIQNFLWFFLFIIPGIVKYYSYRMVPYILADNPNIGYKKAIELSNKMTYGHKFDMFVLDLSFIGWYILGTLALIVGVFFVMPYQNATEAELYLVLRRNALEKGICRYEDLDTDYLAEI